MLEPQSNHPKRPPEPSNTKDRGRPGVTHDGRKGPVDPPNVGFVPPNMGGGGTFGDDGDWQPPTAYVLNHLLYAGWLGGSTQDELDSLNAALGDLPVVATFDLDAQDRVSPLNDVEGDLVTLRDELWVTTVTLQPTVAGYLVDARDALVAIRLADARLGALLGLDHVLVLGGGTWGSIGGTWGSIGGTWGSIGGTWGSIGGTWGSIGEYAVPGWGGRAPVHVCVARPQPDPEPTGRRPVVALPDSGIGRHSWFVVDPTSTPPVYLPNVQVGAAYLGIRIGGVNADLGDGVADALTGALEPSAGHGTFVAGIVLQGSPGAALLSIPLLGANGLATEGEVQKELTLLLLRHVDSVLHQSSQGVVDVLSVSMGYYPEDTDDFADEARLRLLFYRFREWGVAVAAGVGNDGTKRRFVPAAFADDDGVFSGPTPGPLASVGAINPTGRSIALFSNAGDWVKTHRCGVSVVSTVPVTVNGGTSPTQTGVDPDGAPRSTVEPDNYAGGFGVWSGTSFATPVLAAELATALLDLGDLDDVSQEALVKRATTVVRRALDRGVDS